MYKATIVFIILRQIRQSYCIAKAQNIDKCTQLNENNFLLNRKAGGESFNLPDGF